MRLSRLLSTTVVIGIASAATIFACGGGGGGNNPDAKVFKDSKPFLDSASGVSGGLGQLCPFSAGGAGSACPQGDACVALQGLGSTTTGYCTPNCGTNASACTTGYTGPTGGMPECALVTAGSGSGSGSGTSTPNACAIICTEVSQCPGGMECIVAQGTTKICVPM